MGLWIGHSEGNSWSAWFKDQLSFWSYVHHGDVIILPSCGDWSHTFLIIYVRMCGFRDDDECSADMLHNCLQYDWKFWDFDHADYAYAYTFLFL